MAYHIEIVDRDTRRLIRQLAVLESDGEINIPVEEGGIDQTITLRLETNPKERTESRKAVALTSPMFDIRRDPTKLEVDKSRRVVDLNKKGEGSILIDSRRCLQVRLGN